jgi:hypothetical protein|tara:strand:+ start:303 stop:1163 length:861 start_codon:yes stop_codon:yes gene_type:complete
MGAEFKYKNPLTIQLGTGVTGSVNGENFTSREIQGLVDENVTINIGQEVETTSNTTFNNVTSSNVLKAGNLFLGDGFISSSNSVVAHTGSVVVTENATLPSMTINGQLNAPDFEVSVTGSTTIFESGSTRFGDSLDDTHSMSGSSSVTGSSLKLNDYNINEISNDTTLGDSSTTSVVTENAVKTFFTDTGVLEENVYLRKSFIHTGSFTSANTSSFNAITASAPSGLTSTTENDFMFFINGMLIENDALEIVQKTSTNLELRLNTSELGYSLESDDEVIGFGKFNS